MRTWAAGRSLNPLEQTDAIHGYVTCGSWACHVVVQSVSQYYGTEWASPDVIQLIMKSRTTGCEKAIRDHFVKKKKKKRRRTFARKETNCTQMLVAAGLLRARYLCTSRFFRYEYPWSKKHILVPTGANEGDPLRSVDSTWVYLFLPHGMPVDNLIKVLASEGITRCSCLDEHRASFSAKYCISKRYFLLPNCGIT